MLLTNQTLGLFRDERLDKGGLRCLPASCSARRCACIGWPKVSVAKR